MSEDKFSRRNMVPKAGVEPARPKAQPPQDCVSANSTTSARIVCVDVITTIVVLTLKLHIASYTECTEVIKQFNP